MAHVESTGGSALRLNVRRGGREHEPTVPIGKACEGDNTRPTPATQIVDYSIYNRNMEPQGQSCGALLLRTYREVHHGCSEGWFTLAGVLIARLVLPPVHPFVPWTPLWLR